MKIEKVATEYETRYIANDGKMWKSKIECEQYEELLTDSSPLQKLHFFDKECNPIDIFQLKDIPHFCYLVLEQDIQCYRPEVVKAIVGNNRYDDASYKLPTTKGVWYNDWSSAYSGGYGRNGWEKLPSIESLQNTISYYKERIEKIKKMTNCCNE